MRDRLVEKLKKHDEKALSQIIEQQSRFVASVIYNTSKGSLTKEDIEEVTADVFVTLWNNTEKVQEGKLQGYMEKVPETAWMLLETTEPQGDEATRREGVDHHLSTG